MLDSLFKRARGWQEKRRDESAKTYAAYVESTADGNEPTIGAEFAAALEAAGKSVDEFEADVRRELRRRELQAILAETPAVDAQRKDLLQRREKVRAGLRAARNKAEAANEEINQRLNELHAQEKFIERAQRELRDLAPDPLKQRLAEIADAQHASAIGQEPDLPIEKLDRQIQALEGQLAELKEDDPTGKNPNRRREVERELRAKRTQREHLAAHLAEKRRRLEELDGEAGRVREEMLVA